MPNRKTAPKKNIKSARTSKVHVKTARVSSSRESRSVLGFKWNPLYTYLILGIVIVVLVILYNSMTSSKGSDPSLDSQLPSSAGVNINTPYK